MVTRALDDSRRLRPLTESDADELYALIDSEREMLARWMPWAREQTHAQTVEFIARATRTDAAQDGATAAVVCDEAIVGCVSLDERSRMHRRAKIGYWLAAPAQRRGTMTLATAAMLDHAFADWDLHRVEIRAGVDNAPSRAIPERLGFTLEGTCRQCERVDGRWVDHAVYGLVAPEWRGR